MKIRNPLHSQPLGRDPSWTTNPAAKSVRWIEAMAGNFLPPEDLRRYVWASESLSLFAETERHYE